MEPVTKMPTPESLTKTRRLRAAEQIAGKAAGATTFFEEVMLSCYTEMVGASALTGNGPTGADGMGRMADAAKELAAAFIGCLARIKCAKPEPECDAQDYCKHGMDPQKCCVCNGAA